MCLEVIQNETLLRRILGSTDLRIYKGVNEVNSVDGPTVVFHFAKNNITEIFCWKAD
jgi:hypothetical protein